MPNSILTFNDKATQPVALLDDGTITYDGTPGGAWTTDGVHDTNQLQYILPDKSQATADLTYSMDAATNRLVVAVNGGAPSSPLNGFIVLEGHEGILYKLINSEAAELTTPSGKDSLGFWVYGKVTVDPALNTLTVQDGNAGAASNVVIKGTKSGHGNSAVIANAGLTNAASGLTTDVLTFVASTTDSFTDATGAVNTFEVDAEIAVNGAWDLKEGQTVFTAALDFGGGSRLIDIVLIGQLKAVSYCVQFTGHGDDPTVLFEIAGKIDGTDTDGKWKLVLGYSKKSFSADLDFSSAPRNGANGFTINGSLQLSGAVTGKLKIALALDVKYKFNNGSLDLSLTGKDGDYNLDVSGTLNLDVGAGYKVTFAIDTSTSGGLKSFDLEFGPANPGSSLNSAVSGAIGWDGKNIKISLNVQFDWSSGHLMPQNPPPVPKA